MSSFQNLTGSKTKWTQSYVGTIQKTYLRSSRLMKISCTMLRLSMTFWNDITMIQLKQIPVKILRRVKFAKHLNDYMYRGPMSELRGTLLLPQITIPQNRPRWRNWSSPHFQHCSRERACLYKNNFFTYIRWPVLCNVDLHNLSAWIHVLVTVLVLFSLSISKIGLFNYYVIALFARFIVQYLHPLLSILWSDRFTRPSSRTSAVVLNNGGKHLFQWNT